MGLLGSVGGSVAAGDAAEHHEVARGIAADAVAAVHTAGGLTGCVQAGDDAAVGVQHLCVGVDLQAAHGVVDARCDLDGVVGSGGQVAVHAVAAAELGVLTGCHRGVPGVHGLHKVGGSVAGQAHLLGQTLIAVGRDGQAVADVLLAGLQVVHDALVKDNVGVSTRLLQLGVGNRVTGGHVVAEALALGVDQDAAHAAHALGHQHAGLLIHGGVQLDLVHVHGVGTNGLSHQDAVAGGTGVVGGHGVGQGRVEAGHQLKVGTKAAGGNDHALGVDGVVVLGALGLDAAGSAVVGQDLGGLGVQQDLHAQLFGLSYRVLRRDRMYAVFGKGHPLEQAAAREGSFAWEWLEGQTLLLQNQTQRQGQYILQELRSRRLHPAEILESSNIRAAAALAANGYGIGFLSGELLEHLNNAVPFNAFPLRDCTLPLESVAAWRAGNYLPRYALAFIERMEQLENQKCNNSATKAH